MSRIYIKNLALEMTNKCNLECSNCINKDTKDTVMSTDIIETIFAQIHKVNSLHIYGGEPTLVLDKLERLFKTIIANRVVLYQIDISINGSNYNKEFLELLDYINLYMNYILGHSDVKFNILNSNHHNDARNELGIYKESLENIKKYMQSRYFYEFYNEPKIITRSSYFSDYYITYMNKLRMFDRKNGMCSVGPIVSINPNGIITKGDASIEEQEILYNYGSVLENSIEDIVLSKGKILKPIDWYYKTYKTSK